MKKKLALRWLFMRLCMCPIFPAHKTVNVRELLKSYVNIIHLCCLLSLKVCGSNVYINYTI